MATTRGTVEQLIEVAPRLARMLVELVEGLRGERMDAALSPEDATRINRALAVRMEGEGIPHRIDTAPISRRSWAEKRRLRATEMHELQQCIAQEWRAFTTAFEAQRSSVAGLVHRPFFECHGRAKATSACESLHRAAQFIAEIIDARPLKLDDLAAHERDSHTWHELLLGVEVEVAELQRRQRESKDQTPSGLTLRAKAFRFLQVLRDATGQRLTQQEVVLRAFPKASRKVNTDDKRAMKELVAGKRVQTDGEGPGSARSYWVEASP